MTSCTHMDRTGAKRTQDRQVESPLCPTVGPWLPALKIPGPMGRHADPLLLAPGWLGQVGGSCPWERSRGAEPQEAVEMPGRGVWSSCPLDDARDGRMGQWGVGGRKGVAACGQAAPEAPSLGRYLPCPDPKYNYVSSAGQDGSWKLLHCGHSKVSQVMCVPGMYPLKCLHKSLGSLPLSSLF